MFLHFLCHQFQFGIPVLTKLTDKRFFQELIHGEVFFPSQQYGSLADIPAMIVHGLIKSVVAHPYRIEMAGYGFVEVGPALPVSFLDGAIATALIIIASKDTILIVFN